MKSKSRLFLFAYLIGEVYWYSLEATNFTFICHNERVPGYYSRYIRDDYFCDGKSQCGDGEDEHLGCKRERDHHCKKGEFMCDGNRCFNITVRCNTKKDCNDGTDEQNCGDELDVKNCTSEDKFLCKDGLRCLGLEETCNNYCNCFDCSDENVNCLNHDDNLSQKCPNTYFNTPDGPKCFCQSDKKNSSTLCNSIGRCIVSSCDQHCIFFASKYSFAKTQCSCYEGYTSIKGSLGVKCKTTADFAVLYANKNEIKYVNNTSLKSSTIVQGIDNCTLLTAANNYVYYTTLSQDNKTSIFKKALNSGKPEKLIETDFAITSIAVDYITNNVYFTGNGSLSVCTSNGQICTQLKCCNVDMVTLAPKSGWMYYMRKLNNPEEKYCKNGALLTRSNMDGSNETIHKSDCFGANISMEMDESKNVINLLKNGESHVNLYRISVDSAFELENMKWFSTHTDKIRHFSFHNDDIFFIMDGEDGIFYFVNYTKHWFEVHQDYKKGIYLNDKSTSSVTDLYVYNAAIQQSDENPCEKSSCSGLCLLKPVVGPSMYSLNHTCFCDGFTATNDDHWCSNDSTRSNTVVWVIACVSIVIILCAIAYLLFMKRNWRRHLPVVVWNSKNESEPSVIK